MTSPFLVSAVSGLLGALMYRHHRQVFAWTRKMRRKDEANTDFAEISRTGNMIEGIADHTEAVRLELTKVVECETDYVATALPEPDPAAVHIGVQEHRAQFVQAMRQEALNLREVVLEVLELGGDASLVGDQPILDQVPDGVATALVDIREGIRKRVACETDRATRMVNQHRCSARHDEVRVEVSDRQVVDALVLRGPGFHCGHPRERENPIPITGTFP